MLGILFVVVCFRARVLLCSTYALLSVFFSQNKMLFVVCGWLEAFCCELFVSFVWYVCGCRLCVFVVAFGCHHLWLLSCVVIGVVVVGLFAVVGVVYMCACCGRVWFAVFFFFAFVVVPCVVVVCLLVIVWCCLW